MGNIDSISRAIENVGYQCILSNKKKEIEKSDVIVLPGQGAFDTAMKNINELKIKDVLIEKSRSKTFFLGICLGMQIMANFGYENKKKTKGLGLIDGEVKILKNKKLKLPHLGWSEVNFLRKDNLFKDIPNKKDYYFLHSYYFDVKKRKNILGSSNYGFNFPSIIKNNNNYGFQFHPEKSLWNGISLIRNFIEISVKG